MGVRAKFRCVSKEERVFTELEDETGQVIEDAQVEIKFQPVYASGPLVQARPKGSDGEFILMGQNAVEENAIFGAATPAGSIAVLIKNQAAADQFKAGRAYYVDFTPAEG